MKKLKESKLDRLTEKEYKLLVQTHHEHLARELLHLNMIRKHTILACTNFYGIWRQFVAIWFDVKGIIREIVEAIKECVK